MKTNDSVLSITTTMYTINLMCYKLENPRLKTCYIISSTDISTAHPNNLLYQVLRQCLFESVGSGYNLNQLPGDDSLSGSVVL